MKNGVERMKKKVWIFNHYASSDYMDKGGRHYWISKYLKRSGYEPTIFCCNKIHNTTQFCFDNNKLFTTEIANEINVTFVFIKARDYKGNGKQRILNMIDFYKNLKKVAKIYAKKYGSPNIVYASSAHPLTLIAGIQLAGRFNVKCICEIRDLWPESFVIYGILRKKSLVAKFLYYGEHQIYRKANAIIFTMEGGKDYILDRGWDKDVSLSKIYYINNGIDLDVFDKNKKLFTLEDSDLKDRNIFKAVYVGSIRKINDLDSLLSVAKKINNKKIKILIWGNGDYFNTIKERIGKEKITNVVMKGSVAKQYIPYIVSHADVCLMHGKTSEIAKYGMSPNKLFEYLAAGKPVISTLQGKYNVIILNGAGVSTDVQFIQNYSETIEKISNLKEEEYQSMCNKSRIIGEEFDFKKLTKKLIEVIESI